MKNIEETIKLLNHIHENPEATQRELVDELDVSLGKVNFLIKSLAKSGIVKLSRFKNSKNKAGYMYIITPKGLSEKTRILKQFLETKLGEYTKLKREIELLKDEVAQI